MSNRNSRRATSIAVKKLDASCDIQVDGKADQCVMIIANPHGRKIVEDAFPDVEWTTDQYMSCHSSEWLFTHIRITKLPASFEAKVPLPFCKPDALGFAVAFFLQQWAPVGRVIYYSGDVDSGLKLVRFGECLKFDLDMFAEHVPAGTIVGEPQEVH
jgi:hypothetical protein